jgi:hypothetical protein
MKPRFFRRHEDWEGRPELDGFHVAADAVHGRFEGTEFVLRLQDDGVVGYEGRGFRLTFDPIDPAATLQGEGPDEVDLTHALILLRLHRAILDPEQSNYLNCLGPEPRSGSANAAAGDPSR